MKQDNGLFLGIEFDLDSPEPINFIETRLNDLSPFSAHEVLFDGVVYKTAEHAYQALRVKPEYRLPIVNARCPMDAWREGQNAKLMGYQIESCDKDQLMEQIFKAKLEQHSDVRQVLLVTGNRSLIKVYPTDWYWGTGSDGSGQNKMGELWMRLRSELQDS